MSGAHPRPHTPTRRPSLGPVLVVVGFFVVAITLVLIGAQRSAAPAPSVVVDRAGTPDEPRAITILMRDYLFEPTPVVLVAGETVRITVFAAGLAGHEMVLGDASVQDAWSRANAAATPTAPFATAPPASVPPHTGGLRVLLASGERTTVDFEVPTSTELQLMCHLPGHVEQGMVGSVEVRAAPAAGAADPVR